MARCLIIGGGIFGTMHARQALNLGHDVIHVERDPRPRSSSARNFGLVWIGGRASGEELSAALRTRELWDEVHREIPELLFRANGSLTLAVNDSELRVMEECLAKDDAQSRGWELLDPQETQMKNPELKGKYLASLWCPLDATIEPDFALASIRENLLKRERYEWRAGFDISNIDEKGDKVVAKTVDGELLEADIAIVCPGADHSTLFKKEFGEAPLRKVRLQMANTEIFHGNLSTSIADGDSMRYYPAYQVPSLASLPPQSKIAEENHMQLLCVQRADGTLTIGDTHEYDEPFEFKLREDAYSYLHDVASSLLGQSIPPFAKRWEGVYSQRVDGAICDRRFITSKIITVTGGGGRGNTLAPVIAETTFKELA